DIDECNGQGCARAAGYINFTIENVDDGRAIPHLRERIARSALEELLAFAQFNFERPAPPLQTAHAPAPCKREPGAEQYSQQRTKAGSLPPWRQDLKTQLQYG